MATQKVPAAKKATKKYPTLDELIESIRKLENKSITWVHDYIGKVPITLARRKVDMNAI